MRLVSPQWPAPTNVHSFATTRSGGVSLAPYESLNLGDHVGDNPSSVITNRLLIGACLPCNPIWLTQTHGTLVSTPSIREQSRMNEFIAADASVTNNPNEVLAILTADCLPILFASADGSVIGAAHAGWRGLHAGVIENTLAEILMLAPGILPKDVMAWMGPAIGPESFEVGEDVVSAFGASDNLSRTSCFNPIAGKPGKYLADIYQLARNRMNALGIMSIYGGDRCTVKEGEEFFSYRRDGKTGRFASFIWISN